MAVIKNNIIKEIGVSSVREYKMWRKEINLISWNWNEPKYNIRDWDLEYEKMGKATWMTKNRGMYLKEIFCS